MTIRKVDHVNITTQKLEETRAFYVDVLGLEQGPRPDFSFAGYWLYANGCAIVHLQEAREPMTSSERSALSHVAFDVADFDATLARLDAAGMSYRASSPPGTQTRQAFVSDPNGAVVELNWKPG